MKVSLKKYEPALDKFYQLFVGTTFLVLGIVFCIIAALEEGFVLHLLLSIPAICMGLSLLFPKSIGLRIKPLLKSLVFPFSKIWRKYGLGQKINELFENRFFQAVFFFVFSIWGWYALASESGFLKLFGILGTAMFLILGLACLIPRIVAATGILLLCIAATGIIIWAVSATAATVGIIPVSIIIGALIIASAITATKN